MHAQYKVGATLPTTTVRVKLLKLLERDSALRLVARHLTFAMA